MKMQQTNPSVVPTDQYRNSNFRSKTKSCCLNRFPAAPVWMNCATTHMKKLQGFQNKILKMILGKPQRTPTIEIHKTTGVEMLQTFVEILKHRLIGGCRSSTVAEIKSLVTNEQTCVTIASRLKHSECNFSPICVH